MFSIVSRDFTKLVDQRRLALLPAPPSIADSHLFKILFLTLFTHRGGHRPQCPYF